jgi:predicted N-acetyltransferase YhbS
MAGDPRLIIRAVRPSEYEIAGELTVEAYRTLSDAGDEAAYERQLRDIAGRRDTSEILVAEVGGRVIGCVTFVDGLKALSEVDDPDAATVRMLGVAAEARGRGVGEALTTRVHRSRPPIRTEARSSAHATVDDERPAPLRAAWFPA